MAQSDALALPPPRNQWWDVWDQFKTHRGALLGAIVFTILLLGVFLGPWLWTIDPGFIDIRSRNLGMSFAHPMGTDQLGRDIFARMLKGGQTSIAVGLTAMLLSLVIGTFVGALAGYFRLLDGVLYALDRPVFGLALIAIIAGYLDVISRTFARLFWPRDGYIYFGGFCHWHNQLDANRPAWCAGMSWGLKSANLFWPPVPSVHLIGAC